MQWKKQNQRQLKEKKRDAKRATKQTERARREVTRVVRVDGKTARYPTGRMYLTGEWENDAQILYNNQNPRKCIP